MDIKIDKDLLRNWCDMEDFNDYLERLSGFSDNAQEGKFEVLLEEYERCLKERIAYCKEVINEHKDPLVYYTLAELFNRRDPDESPEYLYKRAVRYYCIKTIRLDRRYGPAWALLAYAYSWIALFGGDIGGIITGIVINPDKNEKDKKNALLQSNSEVLSEGQKKKIKCIEKAIYCIRQALKAEPKKKTYQMHLKQYCHQRNEEYKPEGIPRKLNL
ncbi:MAG: hypothetical protein ABIA97_00635 [Candidatus Omnitrophota bacterium]